MAQTISRNLSFAALLLACCSAMAQIIVESPAPGVENALPVKFSGTNCIASGSFNDWTTNERVLRAELYIVSGSTEHLVHEANYPTAGPKIAEASLRVRFASTHFSHGSSVSFKMVVLTDLGTYEVSSPSRVVYNKGIAYEHGDFASVNANTGVTAAATEMEIMKHAVEVVRNGDWGKAQLLGDISLATAVHIGTHGAPGFLYDNYNQTIDYVDIAQSRLNVAPKINVVLLDACSTAADSAILSSFLQPGWPAPMVDQAAVGFSVDVLAEASKEFSSTFWHKLKLGQTVDQAKGSALTAYNIVINAAEREGWGELQSGQVIRSGDGQTTLNRAYTGSITPSPQVWYVRLS